MGWMELSLKDGGCRADGLDGTLPQTEAVVLMGWMELIPQTEAVELMDWMELSLRRRL
jgi:hypothetical protein